MSALLDASPFIVSGRVTAVSGLEVVVRGLDPSVGSMVTIGPEALPGQVVAIRRDESVIMPLVETEGIGAGDRVEMGSALPLLVGDGLCGRVIDALGRPILRSTASSRTAGGSRIRNPEP